MSMASIKPAAPTPPFPSGSTPAYATLPAPVKAMNNTGAASAPRDQTGRRRRFSFFFHSFHARNANTGIPFFFS
jgi:hypothetical protein